MATVSEGAHNADDALQSYVVGDDGSQTDAVIDAQPEVELCLELRCNHGETMRHSFFESRPDLAGTSEDRLGRERCARAGCRTRNTGSGCLLREYVSMHCVNSDTISTIEALRAVLMGIERPLMFQELKELAARLQLAPGQWRKYLNFAPHRFSHRSVYQSRHFEVNIIGWRSGQFSSIHNHRGTACCVLVLEGVLTNVDYAVDEPNELRIASRLELRPGELLSRNDSEIHRCGNTQPSGVNLATLHLYSPPLRPLDERQHYE